MRRSPLVAGACAGTFAACVGGAPARGHATLRMRLTPAHPAPGTTATIRFEGVTARTAIPLAIAVAGSTCPKRIPASATVLVPPNGVATGGIAHELRARVARTTTRFCGYLVPASEDAYGNVSYTATAPPLATAQAEVVGTLRAEWPLGGGSPIGGTLLLSVDRGGTRVTRIQVTCGGDPRRPPSLGKAFIGKRFVTRVSIALARRIRWSGPIAPDNSRQYDEPIPAQWRRATRLSIDVRVVDVNGAPGRLVGTGRLTSPGLPCPVLRRYA